MYSKFSQRRDRVEEPYVATEGFFNGLLGEGEPLQERLEDVEIHAALQLGHRRVRLRGKRGHELDGLGDDLCLGRDRIHDALLERELGAVARAR